MLIMSFATFILIDGGKHRAVFLNAIQKAFFFTRGREGAGFAPGSRGESHPPLGSYAPSAQVVGAYRIRPIDRYPAIKQSFTQQ